MATHSTAKIVILKCAKGNETVVRTWSRDGSINKMRLDAAVQIPALIEVAGPEYEDVANKLMSGRVLYTKNASYELGVENEGVSYKQARKSGEKSFGTGRPCRKI